MFQLIKRKSGLFLLSVAAFLTCYPVFFLLTGALMGNMELREYLGPLFESVKGYVQFPFFPQFPTLKSYVEVLLDSPEFFIMFWNSVKMTGGILAGQMLFGIPAAWGFAKYEFPMKKLLFLIYMVLMMMPFQVTMLSNYIVLDKMGLMNRMASVVLPGVFSTFPVFLMYRFFREIPDEILESARIDGASEFQIFFHFGLPLGMGGIIAALVLGFLEYWNLIEQPLTFLKDKSLWPLSLYLPNIDMQNLGQSLAASCLALFPALLVFLAGQEYLEQGIAASGRKE